MYTTAIQLITSFVLIITSIKYVGLQTGNDNVKLTV